MVSFVPCVRKVAGSNPALAALQGPILLFLFDACGLILIEASRAVSDSSKL